MVIIREISHEDNFENLYSSRIKHPIILTPGPKEADNIRYLNQQFFFQNRLDPITMSNFTNDMIDRLCRSDSYPKNFKTKVYRKAEIFLNLAGVWESVFGSEKDELFYQAYRVVSELRGSTLDLNLISEALNLLSSDLKKAVSLMWAFIDEQGIVDEHRAYKLIEENATRKHFEHDGILVVGFNHLSAVQVDMLNHISDYMDVIVTLPKGIMNNLTRFDWPMWLEQDEALIKPQSIDDEDKKKLINTRQPHKAEVFAQNRLGDVIGESFSDNIILLKDEIEMADLLELPIVNYDARISNDIYSDRINSLYEEIRSEKCKTLDEYRLFIKFKIKESLIKQSDDPSSFVDIKVAYLFHQVLNNLEKEYVGNITLTDFILRVVKNVCLLNAPRSSIVSYTGQEENKCEVLSINDLKLKKLESVNLIIKRDFLPFGINFDASNRELVSFLSTIGPIKNASLNNRINLCWLLMSLDTGSENRILIEVGAKDLGPELLQFLNIEVEETILSTSEMKEIRKDSSRKYEGKINKYSATLIQTYLDCPKKFEEVYYYQNKNFPKLKNDLLANALGTLEHEIIAHFYEHNTNNISEDQIREISKELLSKFVINQSICLTEIKFQTHLNELVINSLNGIKVVDQLKNHLPDYKFEFEFKISSEQFAGSIDLLIHNESDFFIFDFKRSQSGASSHSEMMRFESIQLPFYQMAIENSKKIPCKGYGYIVLNNLNESVHLFSSLSSDKIKIPGKIKDISTEDWDGYRQKFNDLFDNVKNEIEESFETKDLIAFPKKQITCEYCPAKLYCTYEGKHEKA